MVLVPAIVGRLARQLGDEFGARESSLERPATARAAHGDVIVVEPEAQPGGSAGHRVLRAGHADLALLREVGRR